MIAKMKAVCGFEYTSKLQRMFDDISTSKELLERFQESKEFKRTTVEFSILVLGAGFWPLKQPVCTFTVPQALADSCRAFEEFYDAQHSGRKLTWLYQLSKGELKVRYLDKSYVLVCSTYQIGILLQFNSNEKMDFEELISHTQLDEDNLINALYALVRLKVLSMNPKPSGPKEINIDKNCSFKLNSNFKKWVSSIAFL